MKKTRLSILILLVLVMLLTACGGQNEKEVSEDLNSSSKNTLNLALNQVVETLNPFEATALIDWQFHRQVYETLFFVNDSNEFEPRLAETYEALPDNTTYVVHLREGVKFQNGEPVTAEDVAWSLNYSLRDGPYVKWRTNLPEFEDAIVIDEHTVEIKSSSPNANFFTNISTDGYILNKEAFLAAKDDGTLGVEWVPFGTGPYTISLYNPDAEIKLKSFPDYYRGEARIKNVNYKILADNTTIGIAFESGDLDLIVVPTTNWENFSTDERFNTYLSPTTHTSFFHINIHNDDALSNKLVRQALSYAIDRESMVIAAYDNIAQPAYSMFNPDTVVGGFTPEELAAEGIQTYEYNPEKAKELLAEAGYSDGLDIGYITTINGSYWEKMSTIFQSNLNDIGVKASIELADSASCRARRKEFDYNLSTTGTNYSPDASYSYQYFRNLTDAQRADGQFSELDVRNEELDALFLKAKVELDKDAYEDIWLEINRIIQDEMYSIPTFHKTIPYAYQKDLVCDEINTNYYYIYNLHWE